jgi:hypothetical protein
MDELGHLGWVAHQSFELGGMLFGVRTDSRRFARWLEGALPATLLREEEAEPNYSISIRDRGATLGKRFHVLYRDSTPIMRTFDAADLVRALLADVAALTDWHRRDAVYLRAMFFSTAGVNALLPEEYISMFDDVRRRVYPMGIRLPVSRRVAVDLETAELIPPPQALEIDAGGWQELARLVPSEPTAWSRVELDREARIQAICTIAPPRSEPVQPVSRAWALYVLGSTATNLSEVGGAGLDALRRLVDGASCWEIAPRRPHLIAESVLDVARTVAAQRTNATVGGSR